MDRASFQHCCESLLTAETFLCKVLPLPLLVQPQFHPFLLKPLLSCQLPTLSHMRGKCTARTSMAPVMQVFLLRMHIWAGLGLRLGHLMNLAVVLASVSNSPLGQFSPFWSVITHSLSGPCFAHFLLSPIVQTCSCLPTVFKAFHNPSPWAVIPFHPQASHAAELFIIPRQNSGPSSHMLFSVWQACPLPPCLNGKLLHVLQEQGHYVA